MRVSMCDEINLFQKCTRWTLCEYFPADFEVSTRVACGSHIAYKILVLYSERQALSIDNIVNPQAKWG